MTRYYRCEMNRAVAKLVIRQLIDLKIPLQTEYLRSGLVLVVPGTYADTLHKIKTEAEIALAGWVKWEK